MTATIACALLGVATGVAVTSDTQPRISITAIMPLIGLVIVAATIGRL